MFLPRSHDSSPFLSSPSVMICVCLAFTSYLGFGPPKPVSQRALTTWLYGPTIICKSIPIALELSSDGPAQGPKVRNPVVRDGSTSRYVAIGRAVPPRFPEAALLLTVVH